MKTLAVILKQTTLETNLKEMFYWGKEKDRLIVDEEITGNDEQIKQAMLQWVTERNI